MDETRAIAELLVIKSGIPLDPMPNPRPRDPTLPHAPVIPHGLTLPDQKLAIQNALRYFPSNVHEILASEFAEELKQYGHIYMYRFRPTFRLRAFPIHYYPTRLQHAAAIIHMIMNNLDPEVAQFPEELVTYGGNGQVFSNWAQFWLVMEYLCKIDEFQTLVMYSGHPLGLFPSNPSSPRMVITNGMVIPNYSSKDEYNHMFALGVSMYGQMTAGSYCYIGSQGIVHGTVLTILNAARKYLGVENLSGKVFVSSGLGGMSGAQAKAAVICGCIGVIAEVNYEALKKRFDQKWLKEMYFDLDKVIQRIKDAKKAEEATSIGFCGNVVLLWERLVKEYETTGELLVDLGSDQTSCHNPYNGGYYPVQISFKEAQTMLKEDPKQFAEYVQQTLRRHICSINVLAKKGMKFWDYGNAFLLEAKRAGVNVGCKNDPTGLKFIYPSYVQDIMGNIFSLGFGPFRWVCTSGSVNDLKKTDEIALNVIKGLLKSEVPDIVKQQYLDNFHWIQHAAQHNLVVGSQARILYSDQKGRTQIALAFNDAVKNKLVQGPIVISRDHHDVSGTDSPYRETSNIEDGSAFTADMAVQNYVGTAFRGATWIALHNGGGVGWGEVINGGFGLVLDGTEETHDKIKVMLDWDVNNGLARRSWSGNSKAEEIIKLAMKQNEKLLVTLPHKINDITLLDRIVK